MKCTICSQDNYISEGIQYLFFLLNKRVNFESVFIIDVMTAPIISKKDALEIEHADLLIFIVDSTNNFRMLEENIFLKSKKGVVVKYICRKAQLYEFMDLLRCEFDFSFDYPSIRENFNDAELSMIACIGSGKSIFECTEFRGMNTKTISFCKRSIMRKLNVNTSIKLYDVVMKCTYVNKKLSSLFY